MIKRSQKPIMVKWLDSTQPVPGWHLLTDMPDLAVAECVSVGFVVAENANALMLAPNLADLQNGGAAQASGFIRIPVMAILKRVELREAL